MWKSRVSRSTFVARASSDVRFARALSTRRLTEHAKRAAQIAVTGKGAVVEVQGESKHCVMAGLTRRGFDVKLLLGALV